MANRKISEFTALTAPASGDTFAILDVDASGIEVNKKITYANVLGKAPDGTAAAPAFSFNSDTNSGISGGSDTLVLSTGGTAAISVDSSQNVTLSANLTVSGTTTTIDTTTLTVKDKNIEIAKGNGNDAAVDGAGITIDSTDGDKTWNWVDSTDAWTSSEHIHLGDNKKLLVGTGSDLQIYHSGSDSVLANSTGHLQFRTATQFGFYNSGGSEALAKFTPDGACELMYDNSKKIETTSAGVTVTGALTATSFVGALTGTATEATNVTVSANNSTDETVYPVFVDGATGTQGAETDTGLTYNPSTGLLTSTGFSGSGASLTTLNASNLSSGTVNVARLGSGSSVTTKFLRGDNTWQTVSGTPEGTAILSTGESGATKYLREDGDGTCSWQAVPAAVGGASGVDFNDNVKARWGTGNDLEIWHSGSHAFIRNDVTGGMNLQSDNSIWLSDGDGTNSYIGCIEGGRVELRHDNSKKLETTSDGATVSGSLKVEDNNKIKVGTGADLQLYHNGTDSFIKNFTGITRVLADDFRVLNQANDEVQIKAVADGAVNLYHNGTTKLETTSTGATVTGVATVSNGIVETAITIATNHTITTNYNAMSAGPVTVSATVTVPSGSVWTVI